MTAIMNVKMGFTCIAVLALATACSTTPKEQPVTQAPQQQLPPPKPPTAEPRPAATVQQAPIQEAGPLYEGPMPGTAEHFKYMSGDDRVYFAYDRYDLSPQSRDVLRRQAEWLQEYASSIVIIGGNADERGTREYNLALGARRADAVKAFLISQGVETARITTVSYGKERPIDPRSNEEAWSINRNAHTAVMTGSDSLG